MFYVSVLIVLSVLLVITIQRIFTSFLSAYEVDQASLQEKVVIDEAKLNEAHGWVYNKNAIPLTLSE